MAKKKKAALGSFGDSNDEGGSSEEIRSVKENTLNAFEAFKALINQKNSADAAPAEEAPAPKATRKSAKKQAAQEESEAQGESPEVEMQFSEADLNFEEDNSSAESSEAEMKAESESDSEMETEEFSEETLEAASEDVTDEDSDAQEANEAMEASSDDEGGSSEEETDADSDEENEASEDELAQFGSTNIFTEEEPASFLPDADEADLAAAEELPNVESVEGTELDAFESAEIEEVEFVQEEQLDSIVESVLFASDRPVSLNSLKMVFKGTNIRGDKIKRALDRLAVELAGARRGVTLEEVPGGYQLRTKVDNLQFLTRTLKARQFKLSGPALEVLAIVAYKQPVIKHEIDEIRGVESGHLLRALMEKGLVNFEGKSDLPGKPMNYATTKKFLEIFGLRNLKELPTLSQIDELLPEGMTEEEAKPTLSQVTDSMSQAIGSSYSEGEEELNKIEEQLTNINASSEFFEQEKLRQKQKRDAEKAQNIREAIAMGEEVPTRDRNWLTRYDEALSAGTLDQFEVREKKEAVQEEKQAELDFIEDDNSGIELAADDSSADSESETESQSEAAHSMDEDNEPSGEASV